LNPDEKERAAMTERQKTFALTDKMVLRSSLVSALFSLAQIRSQQGNYGAANETLGEVEKLLERMRADKSKTKEDWVLAVVDLSVYTHQATALRIRGRVAEAQGNETEAIKNYLESVALFSQLSGGRPSGALAGLRARLATLYASQNKFDEARANVREAMRIRARLHQESGTTYALMQASRIEIAAKNADAALKFARQAKASALQVGLEDMIAEAGEVEADALLAKNADNKSSLALEQAIVGYKSAIEVYRQAELRPLLVRALSSLGATFERAGRAKDAEAVYKEAVQVVESIRTSFSNAEQSEGYSNRRDITEIYRHLVDLLANQGRAEEALQYATRAQRRDLIDSVPKGEIKLSGKAAEALKQVAVAEGRENAVRAKLEKNRDEPTGAGSVQQQKSLTTAIGAARQDYALAIKRLEIEQPNLRFTVRPTDLLKLQTSIAPDEALVSYLVTPEKLFVFVVRKGAVAVRPVDVKQIDLLALVAKTREGLDGFATDFYQLSADAETGFAEEKKRPDLRIDDKSEYYKKNLAPLKGSLVKLHEKLIEPIDDLIKDAKTLKIIPNAELFLLPFAALVSPADNTYLLEKYNLTFMTAGDLITTPQKPSSGSLVAFGNPTEANLDGALEEVRAIQKVFPGSTLFTEDKATKEQLFKLNSAKILHFATHGHIRSPLENSNIQLAHLPNINQPDLSYGEIYALPLESTEMVVLSACQTALGTVSGTEVGVFIEAFRTKTDTVAASLWSVDDIATLNLMVEFYKNLAAGQTRSSAMRAAQLKLLRDGRMKNPLFWAAFVLYGDGGRLSAPTQKPLRKTAK
jgi:CHAT domain-containing protein